MPPVNPDPTNPIAFEMWKLKVKEHNAELTSEHTRLSIKVVSSVDTVS
jgi:hypothetical protein